MSKAECVFRSSVSIVMVRFTSDRRAFRAPLDDMNWTNTLLTFVSWCQGKTDVRSNLSQIANYFGAEAVSLSRWDSEKSIMRFAGSSDCHHGALAYPLNHGYADVICGSYVDDLKPGVAIFLSELLDGGSVSDPHLEQFMFKRGIIDVAVICIGRDGAQRDMLELHFTKDVSQKWTKQHEELARSFAQVFAGRQSGLMFQTIFSSSRQAQHRRRGDQGVALLDAANPLKLTRSEWRICVLIANGLSRARIADELSIKMCTVQTHLRHIYGKAGVERFHELALLLLSPSERMHLVTLDPTKGEGVAA